MVACWRAWQQASSTSDARPSHEGTLGQQDIYPTAEGGTMDPLIPLRYARVFFDGFLTEPRLDHPEGIAIAPDGAIWCGGEAGQLYRISPDGSEIKLMASTGGFILGLAFDEIGRLYACDVAHQTVYRFDPATGDLTPSLEYAVGRRFELLTGRLSTYNVGDSTYPIARGWTKQHPVSGLSI